MARPLILAGILAGAALGAGIIRDATDLEASYDYVIAGGGLSGLVVANRLSEDPDVSVLVIEYGDFDDTLNVAIPYYASRMQTPDLFFLTSVPQTELNNRTSSLALGATVGGGSTVNGMAWDRGSAAEYDAWEKLGNPGWGWDGLRKYFKKSSTLHLPPQAIAEEYEYALSDDGFGDGPVQVSLPTWQWPETYTYIDAFEAAGMPLRSDGGTDGSNVGFTWVPADLDPVNGTRMSSRKAYWDPASERPNLSILVNTYVATVALDGPHAVGVNAIGRGTNATLQIGAEKEVILAAGAAHTPQILQLSGIGPKDLLESLDIDVVVDLPGVGSNFQDHLAMSSSWRFTNDTELNPNALLDAAFLEAGWDQYWANKTGPMTHNKKNCRVMLTLGNLTSEADTIATEIEEQDPALYLNDIYTQSDELVAGYKAQLGLIADMLRADDVAVYEYTFGGTAELGFHPQKPLSRGTIRIKSKNPHPANSAPSVDFRSLTHPLDLTISILGLKFGRDVMNGAVMATLGAEELTPGAAITDDEQLEELFRRTYISSSNAHPVGTSAMMPLALGGVVDSKLKVYGVEGLRVVDAGIMPMLPSCHTQSTTYAIAEKAADIIKGK